jgi:hypothetical protein
MSVDWENGYWDENDPAYQAFLGEQEAEHRQLEERRQLEEHVMEERFRDHPHD